MILRNVGSYYQSTRRNIPEECPDTHSRNVDADHTLHTHTSYYL